MRMRGHAQHDPAEYVPKEMFDYWKARDPIARYEKFLVGQKLLDEKAKARIEARIEGELKEDLEFAENSPFPPPELAEQGVYCEGCHTIQAEWQRPIEGVMPPKSSVTPSWTVEDFGGLEELVPAARPVPAAVSGDGAGRKASSKAAPRKPARAKAGR
jgi:hypothetical protein